MDVCMPNYGYPLSFDPKGTQRAQSEPTQRGDQEEVLEPWTGCGGVLGYEDRRRRESFCLRQELEGRALRVNESMMIVETGDGRYYCYKEVLPLAAMFYGVKVDIQSPEGITTTRTVPRRFNEFLKLYSELRKEFPKKNLPPAPPKKLVKTKGKKVLRICALECWMTKLLSDIDISRTAPVAIFLELEAAARQACCELNQNESADMYNSGA
ncbi:hypothetical protein L2E82_31144 [Cichorium intybus]|uniref:Uncharacterized protein n=1 Tax=Cichorium intybus TaxID=13427 RepID=A0ACB9D282_CICIN|nr:hypothetical protein L2E82_31144 [Cichorium intybus]